MADPTEPAIVVRGFGFRHAGADRPALDGVTLAIAQGEYVGVLGAAGAGASTLLASLDGVVPQLVRGEARGSVRVLGRDPGRVPVHDMARHVGLVLDDPGLAAAQPTVADEVAFGLENLGVPRAGMDRRIADALAAVGLAGTEARVPSTLSGGELQRLAIAGALVTRPAVLALDEPSANLDPAGRRAVQAAIRRLNRERGVTVVVADQDPEGVACDATRVVVLEAGRVVADGPPEMVLGSPSELARRGTRSTDAAVLAERLGVPRPVPTSVEGVASLLALRDRRSGAGADDGGARPGPLRVEVRDVTFGYPGSTAPALDRVSLDVAQGEVVGLAGANGSGKSTLARLLNGLLRPARGRILVDGLDTAEHDSRSLAARVGLVFQDPTHQLLAATVAEELALGPRAMGLGRAAAGERAREVAAALGLGDLLARHPLRLGRAERKLVALGAVLAARPSVLVLDEPTTGTDPRLAAAIEAQIRRAVGEGSAVLVASHDMALLGRVANRLVVLQMGRVAGDGPSRDVFGDAALLARAGLEAPGAARVALAVAARGPSPWPPVSLDEAAAALWRPGPAADRP